MTPRKPRAVVISLLLGLIVAACSSAGSGATSSPAATDEGSPMSTSGAAGLDQAFIDMMVPHHQAAVEMAKIAQDRATHEELRSLADDIVAAQESEIVQLREWRQAWFDSGETPGMDAMPLLPGIEMPGMDGMPMEDTMDMTMDIEALRTAEPFDQAFIEEMIPHHQSAIAAAEIIAATTERPELKQVAADIIKAQQREIDQMEGWLDTWYPS